MQDYTATAALITGGASGIGLGLARAAAARGAGLAICDISQERLDAAAATLRESGATVLPLLLDVRDSVGWGHALRRTVSELGPIGFLGLNAGIGIVGHSIETTPEALWRASWDVMFMGVVHGLQAALPGMRAHGQPAQVLITSSIGGVHSAPTTAAYSAVKAALISLAEILRAEVTGTCIRVSVLLPQAVRTALPEHSAALAPESFSAMARARVEEMLQHGMDPDEVGRLALDRMADGDFYIFTHDDAGDVAAQRNAAMQAAMRRGAAVRIPI